MPASPYWLTRVPTLADIRGRLKDVLLTTAFDPTNPNYSPTREETDARTAFANCTAVVSSFMFLKEDLTKVDQPTFDGRKPDFTALRAYVLKDSTSVVKSGTEGDTMNYALEAEDRFSLFICYPIRTQARGAISAYVLDDIAQRVMAGFNGACFGRSYAAYSKGIQWYDIDSNWAVLEVTICVPYTVGAMDNPNLIRGERWSIQVTEPQRNTGVNRPTTGSTNPDGKYPDQTS